MKSNSEKFVMVGVCQMTCSQKEDNEFKVEQTRVMLQFSNNVDGSGYFNEDGSPNQEGIRTLTTNLIQGISSNIHYAAEKGYFSKEEHLEFVETLLNEIFGGVKKVLLATPTERKQQATKEGLEVDYLFDEAAKLAVTHQQVSTSFLQRKLKLGYNRAGRIIDQLEKVGIIGLSKGAEPREVFVKNQLELEKYLDNLVNTETIIYNGTNN